MSLHKVIRIHPYLDDWSVRAISHQTCLHHTQTLAILCSEIGLMVNLEKNQSWAPSKSSTLLVSSLILKKAKSDPPQSIGRHNCKDTEAALMSLIELLTATEKLRLTVTLVA